MTTDTTEPTRRRWRRLPWWSFKRVEAWIERYPEMRQEIADREDEIIQAAFSAPTAERIPGRPAGSPSDPTGVRGQRLADDWDLQKAKERCKAIGETLDGLDWAHRELVKVYYWEGHKRVPWVAVGAAIGANEKTCREWRNAIVEEIGGRLGL